MTTPDIKKEFFENPTIQKYFDMLESEEDKEKIRKTLEKFAEDCQKLFGIITTNNK